MGYCESFMLVLALMALKTELAHSQFGYGYRNLFGLTARDIAVDPTCAADGMPCLRMTDCCSLWCEPYNTYYECEPSYCGCPQPPWNRKPIIENCLSYAESSCGYDEECCSGCCHRQPYVGPFGRARAKCGLPPCQPCPSPP